MSHSGWSGNSIGYPGGAGMDGASEMAIEVAREHVTDSNVSDALYGMRPSI